MAKLSISNAWDESREIVRVNFSLLATIALALLVLPGVVSDLFKPEVAPGEFPPAGPWLVVVGLAVVIGLVGQLAIIRLALGTRTTVGEAIGHGLRRAPAYIGAVLIWTLPFAIVVALVGGTGEGQARAAAVGLTVLVLLPVMIFLFVRLMMSAPVASSERGGPLAILRRSWALTGGNWWKLFGFFLLFIVAALVVLLAVGAMAGLLARLFLGEAEPMSLAALFVSLLTQIAGAAATVVFVTMLARIYTQLAGRTAEASVPSTES